MFPSLELFIAGRYLRAKRREGFISLISMLSVAGVMVGVMALVIVIAVMSGAETEFRRRILGVEPHIMVMEYSGRFSDYRNVRDRILSMEKSGGTEIQAVAPLVFGQAMIRTPSGMSGAVIRGVDPNAEASMIKGYSPQDIRRLIGDGVVDMPMDADNEPGQSTGIKLPGIILGKELALGIGVTTGDTVILLSSGGILSPAGPMPAMKRFNVAALFESGMYEYDSSIAYLHLEDAAKLMGMGGRISAMGIWVKDIFRADQVREVIADTLQYPYYARDWMEINKSLFSALKLEKTAMFVILTLIILVAAFNIASALIMMVMEKTGDIALFKAMGATDRMVRNIFIIQGMIIGVAGTLMGTSAGVAVCMVLERYRFIELPAAYPFSTLPVQLELTDVMVISLASVLICFLSTLYPSHRASRMNPVDALRYG
ncbi:MAG: lipoprotein-releasing ABC transporter permease subunit [Desulfamplus sp.]|nr:lipoprotein-releasing ABC transporter permease subunit [Desulfamplus sp.]